MIRATIDTNILASGVIAKKPSLPLQIFEAIINGQIVLVTAERLLAELEDVLNRDYMVRMHTLSKERVRQIVTLLTQLSVVISVESLPSVSLDPDDDILFACAVAGRADYIVSGDKKHVLKIGEYQGIPTITARQLVELLNQEQ